MIGDSNVKSGFNNEQLKEEGKEEYMNEYRKNNNSKNFPNEMNYQKIPNEFENYNQNLNYSYPIQQGGMMSNYYFNNLKMNQPKIIPNFYPSNPNNYTPNQQNFYNKKYSQVDDLTLIQSLKYVQDNYSKLLNLNNNNIGYSEIVKEQNAPRFFVIKSFTEEDIHKSIKYTCWSSTKEGNKKLNIAYDDAKKKNSDIFLCFSVNGSGRFVGIARMASRVDEKMIFEYWAMDEVWKGLMQVEWIFIKDVPNRILKDIKLSNNAYKPVTNSRDTQEIPRPEGEQLIKIFEEFRYQTNILQHFQYYDERQDLFEKARSSQKI